MEGIFILKTKSFKGKTILFICILMVVGIFLNKNLSKHSLGYVSSKDDRIIELNGYNSKNIYIYNITDEKEVASLNANKKCYPASLVKIMTAYVALQNIENINSIAPIDTGSYKKLVNENSSMAGFVGKEKTTYTDLLYGALLASGGECAESLAINVSGNIQSFVEKMNVQAKNFNLKNTQFNNPTGMDDNNQYTTAKDIAMMLKECLKDEKFYLIFTSKDYLSTKTLDHPDGIYVESTVFRRLNKYKLNGFEIIGGKSGTTSLAGLCWATLATKNGKEYIVVMMGTPFEDIKDAGDGHIIDTIRILEAI